MKYLIIDAMREAYGKEDIKTITVGDLLSILEDMDPEEKIVLSHDRGYTFGGIRPELVWEEDEEEEIPDPDQIRELNEQIAADEMAWCEDQGIVERSEG